MDEQAKTTESVMKNRNFLLLFQGSLTSAIAASLYSFAISFYILDITGNNASTQGSYLFVCGLVFVLVSFVGGVLADRWNKTKIVYGTDFTKGSLILISTVLLKIFISNGVVVPQLVVLFTIGIVNNVLAAVFTPASTALIPEIVSKDRLMQANSLTSAMNSIVSILGVILAALFYSIFFITTLFCIIGVLYVISGVTELFIKVKFVCKDETITIGLILRDFNDGLKYLWTKKPIFTVVLASLFLNFFITPITANLMPYIIKTDITGSNYIFRSVLSPESWEAVFSLLIGAGTIVMSIILSSRESSGSVGKMFKRWLVIMAAIVFAVAVSYTLSVKININIFLTSMCAGMFMVGVAMTGVSLPCNVIIQRDVPGDMLAKITSIMVIGSQGLTPIASLIAGLLLTGFSSSILFFFCACGFVLITIFVCCSKNIAKL